MGQKKFQIEILNNGILSYFAGQTIEGILHLTTSKECKNEGINIVFEGKAVVHWTETQRVERQRGKRRTRRVETVHYSAEENYFYSRISVIGAGSTKIYLQPGQYQYPFQFTLPLGLPSSFVGSHGMVLYEIRAEMMRSWKKKTFSTRLPFTVNGIVDLNIEPGASQAMEARKNKSLCFLCCKSGPIGFILRLPRKGFVSGEFLKFTAELNNQSSRKVNGVTITLVQIVSYHANSKTRSAEKTVGKAKGPGIEPGDSETWTGDVLQIPPLPPTRLGSCRIIDVQYKLKIEMDVAGLAINLRHEFPIIIGSIPLRTTYSEIQTLQLQPPQPSFNPNFQEPSSPAPSAPSKTIEHSSQSIYFRNHYPDLPPPTYAETIMQDQFNLRNVGNQNTVFTNDESTGEGLPSAPPAESVDFAPKYITYSWKQ